VTQTLAFIQLIIMFALVGAVAGSLYCLVYVVRHYDKEREGGVTQLLLSAVPLAAFPIYQLSQTTLTFWMCTISVIVYFYAWYLPYFLRWRRGIVPTSPLLTPTIVTPAEPTTPAPVEIPNPTYADLVALIDAHPMKPPKATIDAYKKIAKEILATEPYGKNHVTVEHFFKKYVEFVKELPSHFHSSPPTSLFELEAPEPDEKTMMALYYLSVGGAGAKARELVECVVEARDGNKNYKDWINVPGIDAKKREAVLPLLPLTPYKALIPTLIPSFAVPEQTRFEHTWILGPQGSGKTQLMQYLISKDIEDKCSILVIDSQGDLIKNLSTLATIQDRLLLIEPGAVALNPFDLKGEQALDLLTYVFGALGEGAEMTPKQSALYRYSIRLLQEIPKATPTTFIEILQPEGVTQYREYINRLSEPAQLFFKNQFDDPKQFGQTKQEVAWRLMLLLENPTFEKMFCAPTTKLNLFDELNSNKVILVDTNKQLLGAERSALFGRFFIALLLLAAEQRATQDRKDRKPTFVYIDEAQEYLSDSKVTQILDQARKMKIGMTLANQRSQQIGNPNTLDALLTTSIKYVHTDNDRDTHLLDRVMKTTPDFLANLKPQVFAAFVRGSTPTALSVKVPFLVVENMEHVDIGPLRQRMKAYSPDTKPNKPVPVVAKPVSGASEW